jgi:hypothetical protein
MASYAGTAFGLCHVDDRQAASRFGICGVLKRDELPEPTSGFAFLPALRSQGYALESATGGAVARRDVLRLPRLLAIVNPGERSVDPPAREARLRLRPHDPFERSRHGAAVVRPV